MNDLDLEKTGNFISKLRKERNLTQSELAEFLGVSSKAVSKWETGNSFPDLLCQQQLCKKLNITLEELHNGQYDTKRRIKKEIQLIFNVIVLVILIIIIPLFFILVNYYNSTKDSVHIYEVNNNSKIYDFIVNGILIENKKNYVLYIGKIDLWEHSLKDTDIVEVSLFSNDKLISSYNTLDAYTVNIDNSINIKNLSIKINIYSVKSVIRYSAKLKVNKIINEGLEKYDSDINTNINKSKTIKNLEKNNFVKQDENTWILEFDKKNYISFYLDEKKFIYCNDKNNINKLIIYCLDNDLLSVSIYENKTNIKTLIENYKYYINNKKLDCISGQCSSYIDAYKTMKKYINLLVVE